MKKAILTLLICMVAILCAAQNDSISNVSATQRTDGSGLVDVYFDLDGQASAYNIMLEASFDAGSNYASVPAVYLDSVTGISPGDSVHIVWNGMGNFPGTYSTVAKLKITAYEEGYCPPIVTDIDGNVYYTVVIGTQGWMTENLKTTQYSNSTPIDYPGTDDEAWANDTTGAYAWYDNDISWKDNYGALYNWYAATNTNGLCPQGWHVPSDADWAMLIASLGGESIAGGKMKSTRTEPDAHPRWNSPNIGATNESNWTGLSGGTRTHYGDFGWPEFGDAGVWWTATASGLHSKMLNSSSASIDDIGGDLPPNNGISIRCVWDGSIQASVPTIITADISAITHNTAISGGSVTNNGGATITASGVVWSTSENPTLENNDGFTTNEMATWEFESYLSGLIPVTLYYVKAYASNSEGTGYGQQLSFTTLYQPMVPTVTTAAVTEITYNSATSGGNVTEAGDGDVTERGVVWATFENPTLENNEGLTSDGEGLGEFVSHLSGLDEESQYYVRSYATNEVGTAYGSQEEFETELFVCGTSLLTDIDGNTYNTVLVGDQCWTKENLATTQYSNGISIDYPGTDNEAWANNTAGAYAWYDNDITWKDSYGALYNWYAATNMNGLCPEGWHVPDDDDWTTIVDYLGGNEIAGGKMKSTRTEPDAHPRWDSPNTGATNESNWSGLPGGVRIWNGNFGSSWSMGDTGAWWTTTATPPSFPNPPTIYSSWSGLEFNYDMNFTEGISIRCIKDE